MARGLAGCDCLRHGKNTFLAGDIDIEVAVFVVAVHADLGHDLMSDVRGSADGEGRI